MGWLGTLVLSLLLWGCADAGGGNPDAATDGGVEAPIVERPSDGAFTCSVGQPLRAYGERVWAFPGADIARLLDGSTWLARVEIESGDPYDLTGYSLVASKIDASGELQAATVIPVEHIEGVSSPQLIALSTGRLGVYWIEDRKLRFAALDASGAIAIEPVTIAENTGIDLAATLIVTRSASRVAAVWRSYNDNRAWFLVTDEAGAPATPVVLDRIATSVPVVVATNDGAFAMLSSAADSAEGSPLDVSFARLAADGTLSEPVSVVHATGLTESQYVGDVALVALGEDFLAAWVEGDQGDYETSTGARSVVRVQRLSPAGQPVGEPSILDAPMDSIDRHGPKLVRWDDDTVGVLWGVSTHVYICGGCVPDTRINLVLLDPTSLTPRSNVATLPPIEGGLDVTSVAFSSAADLALALQVQFHTTADPAFAALHCE